MSIVPINVIKSVKVRLTVFFDNQNKLLKDGDRILHFKGVDFRLNRTKTVNTPFPDSTDFKDSEYFLLMNPFHI